MLLTVFDNNWYFFQNSVRLFDVTDPFTFWQSLFFDYLDKARQLHDVDFDHIIGIEQFCLALVLSLFKVYTSDLLTDFDAVNESVSKEQALSFLHQVWVVFNDLEDLIVIKIEDSHFDISGINHWS